MRFDCLQCFGTAGWVSERASCLCKYWVMTYWCSYLFGARCRLFACGPADASAIPIPRYFLPDLNPDLFTSLVLAYQGCPGKRPLNERIRVVMLYSSPLLRNGTASVRPSVRLSVPSIDIATQQASVTCSWWAAARKQATGVARAEQPAGSVIAVIRVTRIDTDLFIYLFIYLSNKSNSAPCRLLDCTTVRRRCAVDNITKLRINKILKITETLLIIGVKLSQ